MNGRIVDLGRTLGRSLARAAIGRLVSWKPMRAPESGFSIVIGVPWDLRHLLPVNLRFVARTDLRNLDQIFIVFDRRPRQGADEILARAKSEFGGLPLEVLWYPPLAGGLVERLNISTFYNSLNTVLALGRCRTKYAVLHDFDLFPLREDHFTSIVEAMATRGWRFSGHEWTFFQGLTAEDRQVGTWTLGIDVEHLRSRFRPIQCFHTFHTLRGERISIDPYAWVQFQTPERGLTGVIDATGFCHVMNLCSTYLRFQKGTWLKVAWRLHYLWYLEDIAGAPSRLDEVIRAMRESTDGVLHVDQHPAEFCKTHASCGEVLRRELGAMERFLFDGTRERVNLYLDEFDRFIHRFGDISEIRNAGGDVVWAPRFTKSGERLVSNPTASTAT